MFDNALLAYNGYYVFGGKSLGYQTSLQYDTFPNNKDDFFVMKYLFDKTAQYDCLLESEITISNFRNNFVLQEAATAFTQVNNMNFFTPLNNFFAVYTSPYSGAFGLLDTMVIPRACAYQSYNMSSYTYFYGQNTNTYNLSARMS